MIFGNGGLDEDEGMPFEQNYKFDVRQEPPSQEWIFVMRERARKALKKEENNRSFILTCCPTGVVLILLTLFYLLEQIPLMDAPVEAISFSAMTLWIGITYSWFLNIDSRRAKMEQMLRMFNEAPMSTANCLMEMSEDPVIREYAEKACRDRYLTVGEITAIEDAWLASGSRAAEAKNQQKIESAMSRIASNNDEAKPQPAATS